jgi:multidrug transporter EmrE-like cation transporter
MNQQLLSALWLILLSITTSVAGQTVIKMGLNQNGDGSLVSVGEVVRAIITSPLVLLGLVFYGVGALSWIAALSRVDLSVAYPFLALNFVLITVVSRLVLGESVPLLRWIGIAIICVGILLVARST